MRRTSVRVGRSRDPEAGFTLVEALIAIVILMIGLVAVSNLFAVASSSNRVALTQTATAAEASEVLERLKAIPFRQLQTGGDLAADSPSTSTTDDIVAGTFNRQRDVPGVGRLRTRWLIVNPGADRDTLFITVESQVQGVLGARASLSRFTSWRTCTSQACLGT